MPELITIQLRRGTASEWTTANTTLAAGEFGIETDTGRFKIGTGAAAWAALGYAAITMAAGDTRYVLASTLGANSGVATLDSGGKIPSDQLPSLRIVKVDSVANEAARLALPQSDDAQFVVQEDDATTYMIGGGVDPSDDDNWIPLPAPSASGLQAISEKDTADGYAGLDGDGLLKVDEFPVIDGGTP